MTKFESYKNKKIGIFGLSKTGATVYKSLKDITSSIICYDDSSQTRDLFAANYGSSDLTPLSNPKWQQLDEIIISPGMPLSHEVFDLAANNKIKITSDIDIFFAETNHAPHIAITGTNGKSTTTALITHILNHNHLNYRSGGNIGIPVLDLPVNADGYVLELSSFQLDLISNFTPTIAVLLNITPDHLDRHGSMEEYIKAKKKIFANMNKTAYAVIGVDNDITKEIAQNFTYHPKIVTISAFKHQQKGVAVISNIIYDNIFEPVEITLAANKYLQGSHNRENIAASYATARLSGCLPESIAAAIASFKGLPHRMEYISSYQNIDFYNDSKATNADAAAKSLAIFDNIYWLAGGIAKEEGIAPLAPYFHKIKKAYLFGQDKEIFASTLKGKVDFIICSDLKEAFDAALRDSLASNDIKLPNKKIILLAPAAASYDQFKNFEHRGQTFTDLCRRRNLT